MLQEFWEVGGSFGHHNAGLEHKHLLENFVPYLNVLHIRKQFKTNFF